jgi:hypothetical protein
LNITTPYTITTSKLPSTATISSTTRNTVATSLSNTPIMTTQCCDRPKTWETTTEATQYYMIENSTESNEIGPSTYDEPESTFTESTLTESSLTESTTEMSTTALTTKPITDTTTLSSTSVLSTSPLSTLTTEEEEISNDILNFTRTTKCSTGLCLPNNTISGEFGNCCERPKTWETTTHIDEETPTTFEYETPESSTESTLTVPYSISTTSTPQMENRTTINGEHNNTERTKINHLKESTSTVKTTWWYPTFCHSEGCKRPLTWGTTRRRKLNRRY